MKCKSCGSELIAGTKKCPYCGAVINIVRTRAEDVFDWSAVSPQSKQKKDVSIDWNTGKIFDKRSGQVYNQNNHTWSEPEDVKDLFKFDRKNEEYQHVLDKQVESASEPASAPAAEAQARADDVKRNFDLPSSMGMRKFDPSTLRNADITFVSESGEEVGSIGKPKPKAEENKNTAAEAATSAAPEPKKPEPKVEFKFEDHDPGKNISTDTGFKFNKADLRSEKPEPPSPAEQPAGTAAAEDKSGQAIAAEEKRIEDKSIKDTYTPEEEDRVYKSLKKLMAAEEKFKSDMERASYITPEEAAQAAKVEEKCNKLTFVPTVSFRTIEDEYAAYCDEHGIKREKPKAKPAEPKTADAAPAEITEKAHHEAKHKKHSLRESIKEGLRSLERDPEKAVEIKINEPSGTKVTVKTQEVSLAAAERELENAPTREVNMEEVVNPPKNLQVSVEVNAAQGNASVEVTRRHDGATVVRTVDKSHKEHLYVDDQEKTKTISDESADDENDGSESGSSFWERPEGIKKMTITDIFGPEARKILNQIDKNNSKEEKKADEDLENSLILDIDPADIAMTEDQTAALHTIAADIIEEEPDDIEEYIDEAEVEAAEIAEDSANSDDEAVVEAISTENVENESVQIESVPEENEAVDDASASSYDVKPEETHAEPEQKAAEHSEPVVISEESAENTENKPAEQPEAPVAVEVNTAMAEEVAAKPESAAMQSEYRPRERGSVNIWASAPADRKSAPEPEKREESAISGIDKIPELEKTRPIMKAEKAIMKEAARQKKRAEKAQKKLLKENKTKKKDDKKPAKSSENRGLSKVLKLFTAILVIILIIEFSIIGIKLFASDSQAAVFIDKVEQYAVDIFRGGKDTGAIDQQTQQDNAAPDAQPDQTAGDGTGETPAEGA